MFRNNNIVVIILNGRGLKYSNFQFWKVAAMSVNNCVCDRFGQYPYVGLNSSVTECPIEIILSGMTYYHHWFKEFVKSKNKRVHFFQMKVYFAFIR